MFVSCARKEIHWVPLKKSDSLTYWNNFVRKDLKIKAPIQVGFVDKFSDGSKTKKTAAKYFPDKQRIEINIDYEYTDDYLAYILYHEYGHFLGLAHNSCTIMNKNLASYGPWYSNREEWVDEMKDLLGL